MGNLAQSSHSVVHTYVFCVRVVCCCFSFFSRFILFRFVLGISSVRLFRLHTCMARTFASLSPPFFVVRFIPYMECVYVFQVTICLCMQYFSVYILLRLTFITINLRFFGWFRLLLLLLPEFCKHCWMCCACMAVAVQFVVVHYSFSANMYVFLLNYRLRLRTYFVSI